MGEENQHFTDPHCEIEAIIFAVRQLLSIVQHYKSDVEGSFINETFCVTAGGGEQVTVFRLQECLTQVERLLNPDQRPWAERDKTCWALVKRFPSQYEIFLLRITVEVESILAVLDWPEVCEGWYVWPMPRCGMNPRPTGRYQGELLKDESGSERVFEDLWGQKYRGVIELVVDKNFRWPEIPSVTLRSLEYAVEDLERVRGKPSETPAPDGPFPPDGFRWQGQEHHGLKGVAWRLVNHLWKQKHRTAEYHDLAEPVWDESDMEVVGDNAFGAARREANRFFRDVGIPIQVEKLRRTHPPAVTLRQLSANLPTG